MPPSPEVLQWVHLQEKGCVLLYTDTTQKYLASDIYLKDEPTTAHCPHVIIGRQERELFYSDQQTVMH